MFCSAGFMAGCLQGRGSDAGSGRIRERYTVGGELGDRLSRNFDRMETELYQPEQVYWTEQESGGWPGDRRGGRFSPGARRTRFASRAEIPRRTDPPAARTPERQRLSRFDPRREVDEQQLSGHGWLLRGLCEYYAWKQDPQALEIARTIVDSLFIPIAPFVDKYPLSDKERIAGTRETCPAACRIRLAAGGCRRISAAYSSGWKD